MASFAGSRNPALPLVPSFGHRMALFPRPNAHEVQFGLLGPVVVGLLGSSCWHSMVPSGAPPLLAEPGNDCWSNAHPCPPMLSGSAASSFSSVTTMTASSESGRRNAARCWRITVSIPATVAMLPFLLIDWNGSGWTRNRYQASFCDSKPQPCSWTPSMSVAKSATSVGALVIGGVGGIG